MLLCGSSFYLSWYISVRCIYNSQRNLISTAAYRQQNVVAFTLPVHATPGGPRIAIDGDELSCGQAMFDIINITRKGDTLRVNCIADTDEDQLRELIASQLFSANPGAGKQLPIAHFRLDHFISQQLPAGVTGLPGVRLGHQDPFTVLGLPLQYRSLPSPPPWFA